LSYMLTTEPDWDEATQYGSYWVKAFVEEIRNLGKDVVELVGDEVTYDNFVDYLQSYNPSAFWGMGHGSENLFTGQNGDILLQKGVNEDLMTGRVVHLLACLCGAEGGLAESLANAGAVCVFAYSRDFILGIESENISPEPDNEVTQSLLEPDGVIELILALGLSAVEAYKGSINRSDYWIDYWLSSGHPDADLIVYSLINNRDALMLYGVPQARLSELPAISPVSLVALWFTVLGSTLAVVQTVGGAKVELS